MLLTRAAKPSRLNSISRLLLIFVPAVLLSITLERRDLVILSFAVIGVTAIAGVGLREFRKMLLPLLMMCAVTMVLHLLFTRTNEGSLAEWGPLVIHKGALTIGLLYCWRIALILLIGAAFVKWIRQEEFAELIWRVLMPLGKLKIPAQEIAMALTIAIRFIPLLLAEYRRIEIVQKTRGARTGGNWVKRIKRSIPIIVPTVASALRRIDTTADALIVRGWGVTTKRTFFRQVNFNALDLLSLIGSAAVVLLVILVKS